MKKGNTTYKIALGVALAAAFLLFWVNGAVGIIGSENNPANLLYLGVFAVGITGAVIARFKPHGMTRAMLVTAIVQVLVPVIAILIWKPSVPSGEAFWGMAGMAGVFVLNGFFAVLFVLSALLFRRAAREQPSASAGQE